MSWATLFDRAAAWSVSEADVRAALSAHRESDEDTVEDADP